MAILNLNDPRNKALVQAVAQQVYAMLPAQGQQAFNLACDARALPAPAIGGGGSGNPYDQQNGQNGMGGSTSNGGCACKLPGGNGNNYPVPSGTGGNCNLPIPSGTGGGASQIGTWGCEVVQRDLAPCQVNKIVREENLPTVEQEIAGPIAAGSVIAVELAPVKVSHELCIEFASAVVSDGGDPPSETALQIAKIGLQVETLVKMPSGIYEHAWTYRKFGRPSYLNVTDGRCACAFLCDCVSAEAHVRVVFTLNQDIAEGETLTVSLWGARDKWMQQCPCDICDECDHELLTDEEEAATTDTVYVVDDGT